MPLDTQFDGAIPELYDECLVPALFAPFAGDMVERARALAPRAVLELAAGTGVVSRALAAALPDARVIATDLNPAMLGIAERHGATENLRYEPADAQALPYGDEVFDLVLCQFGVMFFADRLRAYHEVRRVLSPGGVFLFSSWSSLEDNPGSFVIHKAVMAAAPELPSGFIARTPFGYSEGVRIVADLRSAGFAAISVEHVSRRSPPGSAESLARGMCMGSPLANELAAHPLPVRRAALAAALAAAEKAEPGEGFPMDAIVLSARG